MFLKDDWEALLSVLFLLGSNYRSCALDTMFWCFTELPFSDVRALVLCLSFLLSVITIVDRECVVFICLFG